MKGRFVRRGDDGPVLGSRKEEDGRVETCQLCLLGVREGECLWTIEPERGETPSKWRGARPARDAGVQRGVCGAVRFEATQVFRRGHDPI